MIRTIIFDFGDIFINLRRDLVEGAFQRFGLAEWNAGSTEANQAFEKGEISDYDFLSVLQKQMKNHSPDEIRSAWNLMLGDFPEYRLAFLEELSKKYRLFLLSNTDSIHIRHFLTREDAGFISRFVQCFDAVCFSFELGMRKPDQEIFRYMISTYELEPSETLFVDDRKDNTDAAAMSGLKTWQLLVGEEDVVDLFKKDIPGCKLEKDTYKTISGPSEEVLYKEKGSKFFGYAFPVTTEEEVRQQLDLLRKKHSLARHICYAWQLGAEAIRYRANDDGEPGNTAGMPIYGQIQSFALTNVLVAVVRYFGGVKLGAGGLIAAYRTTAQEALGQAKIIERTIDVIFILEFSYEEINKVMRVIKEKNLSILSQKMEASCTIELTVRKNAQKDVLGILSAMHKIVVKIRD